MAAEIKPELRLEIAHVLFIDIVAHSQLLAELKWRCEWDPVRNNPRFRKILAGPERKRCTDFAITYVH
jgi:hypothetical protein